MPSAIDTNIINLAVEVCTNDEFKRKCLSLPNPEGRDTIDIKHEWNETVEAAAAVLLQAYNLDKAFEDKVLGVVFSIAMRMLTWVEFYSGTFDLGKNDCIDILKPEVFTPRGLIDEQKVADILMRCWTLNHMQEFKLGCHYCVKDRVLLFQRMTPEQKGKLYNPEDPKLIRQPRLVKFWSYFVMGEIDKLKGDKSIDQYKLECAIGSGSQLAIQFCLEKTTLKRKRDSIADAAVEVVKHRIQRALNSKLPNSKIANDWIIFFKGRYDSRVFSWIPDHFFVDIFYFLISKLDSKQKTDMMRKLFIYLKSEKFQQRMTAQTKIFEYFLLWPYQDRFMELMHLSWEWIPERVYGSQLLEIFDRIEIDKSFLFYGEHKSYDYRKLLMEFWISSPDSFKRYAFNDKKVTFINEDKARVKTGLLIKEAKELLLKIFQLENFTPEDMENIKVILNDATVDQRASFLISEDGNDVCIILIESQRFDLFEEVIHLCSPTVGDAVEFKKRYCPLVARDTFLEHARNGKLLEAESSLTKWCDLSDDDIQQVKKAIINSDDGKQTCREIFFTNRGIVENFIEWCFHLEEHIDSFKKTLINDGDGFEFCKQLVLKNQLHLLDDFLRWTWSSKEEMIFFRENLPYKENYSICQQLILKSTRVTQDIPSDEILLQPIDDFLTYCNVLDGDPLFKWKLNEDAGENILFSFIESGKWHKTEEYLNWCELSENEIKGVKREKFYASSSICEFFDDILNAKEGDKMLAAYGSKENAVEQFLQWFLVDDEAVKEFQARYRCYCTEDFIRRTLDKITERLLQQKQ